MRGVGCGMVQMGNISFDIALMTIQHRMVCHGGVHKSEKYVFELTYGMGSKKLSQRWKNIVRQLGVRLYGAARKNHLTREEDDDSKAKALSRSHRLALTLCRCTFCRLS